MLGFGANWLSAALSVTAILYYVFIYTVWLKRRTARSTSCGAASPVASRR
jgi:protoheme IX farnesyltransferase